MNADRRPVRPTRRRQGARDHREPGRASTPWASRCALRRARGHRLGDGELGLDVEGTARARCPDATNLVVRSIALAFAAAGCRPRPPPRCAQHDPARPRPRLLGCGHRGGHHGGEGTARGVVEITTMTCSPRDRTRGTSRQRRARPLRRADHRLGRRTGPRTRSSSSTGASRRWSASPRRSDVDGAGPQPPAAVGPACGRRVQRLAIRAAHRGADQSPELLLEATEDRSTRTTGPAMPSNERPHPGAASKRPRGRGLRRGASPGAREGPVQRLVRRKLVARSLDSRGIRCWPSTSKVLQ